MLSKGLIEKEQFNNQARPIQNEPTVNMILARMTVGLLPQVSAKCPATKADKHALITVPSHRGQRIIY